MAAVTLDLDGTVLLLEADYGELILGVLESHLADAGVTDPDPDAMRDVAAVYSTTFFERFGNLEPDPYETGLSAAVDALVGLGVIGDPGRLDAGVMAADLVAAEDAATVPAPGIRDAIDALADRHALGILTNGLDEVQRRKLASHGLADRFDAVVVSGAVGAHKPAPEVFEAAAEALGGGPLVHVGDNPEEDVEGALAAGHGSVYAAWERGMDVELPAGVPVAGDPAQVPDLVDRAIE